MAKITTWNRTIIELHTWEIFHFSPNNGQNMVRIPTKVAGHQSISMNLYMHRKDAQYCMENR